MAGLLYFLIYPLTFFSSGGMYGGAPVVFAFALVYVFLITEKWERVMALAICIAGSSICYVIAYTHPEKLTRLPNLLTELFPELEKLNEVIRILDVSGKECTVYHDLKHEQLIVTM
jgi:hypothetical protein